MQSSLTISTTIPQSELCLSLAGITQIAFKWLPAAICCPLQSTPYKAARGILFLTKFFGARFVRTSWPYVNCITTMQLSKSTQLSWHNTTIQSTVCIHGASTAPIMSFKSYLFLASAGTNLLSHVAFSGHASFVLLIWNSSLAFFMFHDHAIYEQYKPVRLEKAS